jgi:hypothetical protein
LNLQHIPIIELLHPSDWLKSFKHFFLFELNFLVCDVPCCIHLVHRFWTTCVIFARHWRIKSNLPGPWPFPQQSVVCMSRKLFVKAFLLQETCLCIE